MSSTEESGIVQDSKAGGQLGDPSVSVRPSVVKGGGPQKAKRELDDVEGEGSKYLLLP